MPTFLKIEKRLHFSRKNDELQLKISDHAYGFPDLVISKYMLLAKSRADFLSFLQKQSHKREEQNKYFGGAGLGLLQLIARICHKSELIGRDLRETYKSPSKSSVILSNTADGACLTLKSKLKPLQKVIKQTYENYCTEICDEKLDLKLTF